MAADRHARRAGCHLWDVHGTPAPGSDPAPAPLVERPDRRPGRAGCYIWCDPGSVTDDDGDDLALVTANEADLDREYGALHTPRPIASSAPSARPTWVRAGPRWVPSAPPEL